MKGFTREENEDLAIRFESKFPRDRLNKATLAQWTQVVSDAETLVRIAVVYGDVGFRLAVRISAEAMQRAPQEKMSHAGKTAIRDWMLGSVSEEILKRAKRAAVVAHENAEKDLDRAIQLNCETKKTEAEAIAAFIPADILDGILSPRTRGRALASALRNAQMACVGKSARDAEAGRQRIDFIRFLAET